jgi:hypothetical protein
MMRGRSISLAVLLFCLHEAFSFVVSPAAKVFEPSLSVKNVGLDTNRLRGGSTTVDEMKIEALRSIGASLRRGGHGTARRKFQKVRKQSSKADEAKFQASISHEYRIRSNVPSHQYTAILELR